MDNDITLAVCGLHMRGLPLEKQLLERDARFIKETCTASKYRLFVLPTTPIKPGLLKYQTGGQSIQLELWKMPLEHFGGFVALIPAPLGIGKIEIESGEHVCGFLCEAYACDPQKDISKFGGWREYLKKFAQ
jgi:allophanate hydrolase